MASTPTYLPVYTLSSELAPAETDFLVFQSGATNGDVKLLGIGTFLDAFLRESMNNIVIDQSTIDLYTEMGWEEPTE
jgi:hypothetical protein